jgi:hypothetical protein
MCWSFPPKTNVFARLKALMRFQLQSEHVQALQDTAIHIVANQDTLELNIFGTFNVAMILRNPCWRIQK